VSRRRAAAERAAHYFLVQETNWAYGEGWGEWMWMTGRHEAGKLAEVPGGTPVRLFLDREKAESFRRTQEEARRRKVNPFEYCTALADCTSFPPKVLHDWLLDAGLTPPTPKSQDDLTTWKVWWNKSKKTMTEQQRAKVWEALDRFRFFEVVELAE
jgi:hypothetical protein